MKKLYSFLAVAVMMFAFSVNSFGQATTSALVSATIITPISITNTSAMNFGNIAVNSSDGTVVLPPVGARTFTGGVTLPVVTGGPSAASFNVAGEGTSTYSITLPNSDYTISNGTETMIVNTFRSTPSGTGTLTGGAQVLSVGATLNVNGGQDPGVYTNAVGFDVTVNYN